MTEQVREEAFAFGATHQSGTKRIYGTRGNSFVAVVEFTSPLHARAITAGGGSAGFAEPIAIVAMGEDFQSAVLVVAALKECGARRILARAANARHGRILRAVGADGTLTYDPGWSRDNRTGSWRSVRPVVDLEKCTRCDLCWLYCPGGCIERGSIAIAWRT